MTRRVHIDNLRHLDPDSIEINISEALRRPMVQLSAATMADLVALAEVETLPKALRRALLSFADRMGPEIRDLPKGTPFAEWLADLETVPAARVPRMLRAHLFKEIEDRFEVRPRVQALLDEWEHTPPEVVVPGAGKPVVHRVKTAGPDEARAPRASRPEGAPKPAKADKPTRQSPIKLVDNDRQTWVRDVVLERLADYIEQGLREDVLLAGIKHRARADYPDLTAPEVVGILKDLQTAGRVRHSAGRWRRVLGSW